MACVTLCPCVTPFWCRCCCRRRSGCRCRGRPGSRRAGRAGFPGVRCPVTQASAEPERVRLDAAGPHAADLHGATSPLASSTCRCCTTAGSDIAAAGKLADRGRTAVRRSTMPRRAGSARAWKTRSSPLWLSICLTIAAPSAEVTRRGRCPGTRSPFAVADGITRARTSDRASDGPGTQPARHSGRKPESMALSPETRSEQ